MSTIAGADKTVLTASIIKHCEVRITSSVKTLVLYFFFKNTNGEKDSLLAMTRSFLHQLYVSSGTEDFRNDLASLQENSGKDSMLSDERAWEMLLKHAKNISDLIVVLDALDECKLAEIDELLNRLCLLIQMFEIQVIATSRIEKRYTSS